MYAGAYTSVIGRDKPPTDRKERPNMNPLITSTDQLHWINLDKQPIRSLKRMEAPTADLTARVDEDNLLAIYIGILEGEAHVTMNRILGENICFSSDDPGEWTDIEALIPRNLWPAQVWAGSKWATTPRPHYPAIDAAIAAALADYEANNQ